MAQPFLDDLEALLARVAVPRDGGSEIDCRHFFSGAAAYADGVIFMSLSPVGLALKLPPATRQALRGEGAGELRYFPKAPVKKDYVVLPDNLRHDDKRLAALIAEAIRFSRFGGDGSP